MMHADSDLIYLAAASVIATIAAAFDIVSRKIPNFVTGPALLLGFGLHLSLDRWHGLLSSVEAMLIAGVIFLILYIAGGMGAGDVKLMAAVAAIGGLPHTTYFVVFTALAGGVLALGMAVMRGQLGPTVGNVFSLVTHHARHGLNPHPELNLGNAATLRLPYGLAIAIGCMLTFSLQRAQG
jgi:prepilin peptidase CpaA